MQDLNGNWTQDEPKVPGKGRHSQISRCKISMEIGLKMSQKYKSMETAIKGRCKLNSALIFTLEGIHGHYEGLIG